MTHLSRSPRLPMAASSMSGLDRAYGNSTSNTTAHV